MKIKTIQLSDRDIFCIMEALCDKLDELHGGEEYAEYQDILRRLVTEYNK